MLGKPYYVKTGINRWDCDAERGRQSEVSAAQLVDIDLRDVTQVEEHMRGPFTPTGNVNASGDHVNVFAALSQSSVECHLVKVERHVDEVVVESELIAHCFDPSLGVHQSHVTRLTTRTDEASDAEYRRGQLSAPY